MDVNNTAAPAGGQTKSQVIEDLVSAIVSFEGNTTITDFPEAVSKEAKAVRARATELKDELLLLKQTMEDEIAKIGAPSGGTFSSAAQAPELPGDDPASRFASMIDAVAGKVQHAGLLHLASQLDVVANTLEGK